MEKDQAGVECRSDFTGKRCARAGGLFQCGGVQHNPCGVGSVHGKMSLGTHGNDRDIGRAQHLLCHGAQKQLAHLASAPGPEKKAISVDLASDGEHLLGSVSFANQRIA